MNVPVLLTALAQCLEDVLGDTDYGHVPPCFVGVVPGTQVIQEMTQNCSGKNNGIAWVRLASTYPSETVGVASQRPGNCAVGLGVDIEVGVVRQHEAYFEEDPIDEAVSLDMATWQSDDMLAIRRAVVCCTPLDPMDCIIGQYQPIGPLGGLVGGAWMLHVGL